MLCDPCRSDHLVSRAIKKIVPQKFLTVRGLGECWDPIQPFYAKQLHLAKSK